MAGNPSKPSVTHLPDREFVQEFGSLVGLPEVELRRGREDLDLGTTVLSSNEGFECPPILRVGVESLQRE